MWQTARVRRRQRGTILVAAIVCLVLALAMAGAVARALVIQQRQSRVDQQRLQALWLAESGVARAAAAVAADESYAGEIWQVSIPTPRGPAVGSVEIALRATEQQNLREIQVNVRWPEGTLSPVQYRTKVAIPRAAQGDAS